MEQAAVTSQDRPLEQAEPETLIVICELCDQEIAVTTLDRLAYPFRGGMFDSPDPDHGIPAPWQANEEWADMRCPWGRIHRAMVTDFRLRTDRGMVIVNAGGARIDYEVTQRIEPGRESVSDRKQGNDHGKAEAGPGEPADGQPIKEKKAEERTAKRRKS